MIKGIVTQHLVSLIAKQVDDHGLVVWYDPEGHYREVSADLALPNTTVDRYDGSFFALRHRISPLLDGLHPPRLVVYVPLDPAGAHDALGELEAAGVVLKPGQQPPGRNTRLSIIARNALKPILGEEPVAGVERQADAGKLSLADLDALAETGGGLAEGILALIFGSGNPPDVALAFLASDRHDAEVEQKSAGAELARLLHDTFEVELPRGEPLPTLRARFARHILATDLIAGLGGAVPRPLAAVKAAAKPATRQACVSLAQTWRLRRDLRESYVAAAARVETELGLSQVELPAAIAGIETFQAAERALLQQVETALLDHPTGDLLALAESRLSRFWSEARPALQARWALVAAAAQVLLEAGHVARAMKSTPADARTLIEAYARGDRPWCLLDTHYRHMESRWYNFDPDPHDPHRSLEQLVRTAGQRYMDVGSQLAEHFLKSYRTASLPLAGVLRQVEVYETQVRPRLAEGKMAYVWVDALRFEMARELTQALADDFDLTLEPALATPPTVTEIGMASLLPGADRSSRVVAAGGGKLALEVQGAVIKDRKDRIHYLKAHAGATVYDAKLDDLLPRPAKKVRDGIRGAGLVLITSQEIDELCEQDNLTQARRQMDGVLNDLRRGFRVLRDLGVATIVLAADHGHLFGDAIGDDMKIDAPGGETADLHRRVWVGNGGAAEPSYLRAPLAALGIDSELDLATPWSFACFKSRGGARAYFHGGLSPQELIVPVAVMRPKARAHAGPPGAIDWKLIPGSRKISTRFCSVQVAGTVTGLFEPAPPKVRVEVRAKGKCLSVPVSGSYGFEDATGAVSLKLAEDDPRAIAPNTVTLMIVDEPTPKTVAVHLLDVATGQELAVLDKIEVAIAI